jgi:hypothetical protein
MFNFVFHRRIHYNRSTIADPITLCSTHIVLAHTDNSYVLSRQPFIGIPILRASPRLLTDTSSPLVLAQTTNRPTATACLLNLPLPDRNWMMSSPPGDCCAANAHAIIK